MQKRNPPTTIKKYNWNKITSVVIIMIALIVSISFYCSYEYPTINTINSIEGTISKVIDEIQPEIVLKEKYDNQLIVVFTDSRYPDNLGFALFEKGFLFWHPTKIEVEDGLPIKRTVTYTNNEEKWVIYGMNRYPEVVSYELTNYETDNILTYRNNITSDVFIDVLDMKNIYISDRVKLFDINGNDLAPEIYKNYDDSGPEGGIYRSKTSIMGYIFIIMIGFLIISFYYFRDYSPMIQRIEKIDKPEKEKLTFKEKIKQMKPAKKKAIITFAITILLFVSIYSVSYSASLNEKSLTRSIETYSGSSGVEIQKIKQVDNNELIVLYTTNMSDQTCIASFEKGLNGKYQLYMIAETNDICIYQHWIHTNNQTYIIGYNCDPRIVSYEYVKEYHIYEKEPMVIASKIVTEKTFIDSYNTNGYSNTIKIYDADGKDIGPELRENTNRGARGSSSVFIDSLGMCIILIIGLLIAWRYWITPEKENKSEDEIKTDEDTISNENEE